MHQYLADRLSISLSEAEQLDYIAIAGPTGVGKSSCALALALRFPSDVEIVSVDSVQIYRGLDIGSAKLPYADRHGITHHLIDVCDATERYTAARFCHDATQAIAQIRRRGKIALLTGGTFLYLQAFMQGLSPFEAVTDSAVLTTQRLLDTGMDAAWQQLHQIDPSSASRIASNDRCRIERALHVYYSTGRTMSYWRALPRQRQHHYQGKLLVLWPEDRAQLRCALADRFDTMLQTGLVDEVRALKASIPNLSDNLPSMRSIGYRQVYQYLQGVLDYDTMRRAAIVATRRYLKRQLTWLRRMPDITQSYLGVKGWQAHWD